MSQHAEALRTADRKPADPTRPPRATKSPARCAGPAAQLAAIRSTLGGRIPTQRREEATKPGGLPHRLRSGVEALSGLGMDDVRVHRDSAEPAKLGALAYTRGSDIHLGPGQEEHLAHEAWHVVQQKQGRVSATTQLKGVALNDDRILEAEADVASRRLTEGLPAGAAFTPSAPPRASAVAPVCQRQTTPHVAARDNSRTTAIDEQVRLKDKEFAHAKLAGQVKEPAKEKSGLKLPLREAPGGDSPFMPMAPYAPGSKLFNDGVRHSRELNLPTIRFPSGLVDIAISAKGKISWEHEALEALDKAEIKRGQTAVGIQTNMQLEEIKDALAGNLQKETLGAMTRPFSPAGYVSTDVGKYNIATKVSFFPYSVESTIKPKKDIEVHLKGGFMIRVSMEYSIEAKVRDDLGPENWGRATRNAIQGVLMFAVVLGMVVIVVVEVAGAIGLVLA